MATVPNAANNSMPGSCVCARVCLAPREVKESKESRRFKESKAALGQRGCLAPPEVKEFKEFKVSRGSQDPVAHRAPPVYLARVEHLELVDGLARLGEFRKDEWELLHDDDMQPDWSVRHEWSDWPYWSDRSEWTSGSGGLWKKATKSGRF